MSADPHLQRLVFTVASPVSGEVAEVRLLWTRAGEAKETLLYDDGADGLDRAFDGVWIAQDTGAYVRDVTGTLLVTDLDGKEHVSWVGVAHPSDARSAVLAWQLREGAQGLEALEVSAALPGTALVIPEGAHIYVGMAWTVLLVAVVAGLVHATRREGLGW